MRFEAEFRRGMEFPPIRIDTPRGKVLLEGKIDRLDLLQGPGNERYAKIIDYKSGNNRFDRTLAEKGLMLQLGIYMEAALGRKDAEPAGVFYYHIQEPELASEAENLTADAISEDLWEKLRDQYKMSGFFVDSPEIIRSIDAEVGPGESSSVMNYRLKNDGTAASGGGTSPEDFAVFRAVFRQRLEELCSRLTEGDVSIAPRRLSGTRTACTYCEVKSICSFDTAFSGNKFT
jgi:ATP-dependent helicase/nuclease subunit B